MSCARRAIDPAAGHLLVCASFAIHGASASRFDECHNHAQWRCTSQPSVRQLVEGRPPTDLAALGIFSGRSRPGWQPEELGGARTLRDVHHQEWAHSHRAGRGRLLVTARTPLAHRAGLPGARPLHREPVGQCADVVAAWPRKRLSARRSARRRGLGPAGRRRRKARQGQARCASGHHPLVWLHEFHCVLRHEARRDPRRGAPVGRASTDSAQGRLHQLVVALRARDGGLLALRRPRHARPPELLTQRGLSDSHAQLNAHRSATPRRQPACASAL